VAFVQLSIAFWNLVPSLWVTGVDRLTIVGASLPLPARVAASLLWVLLGVHTLQDPAIKTFLCCHLGRAAYAFDTTDSTLLVADTERVMAIMVSIDYHSNRNDLAFNVGSIRLGGFHVFCFCKLIWPNLILHGVAANSI